MVHCVLCSVNTFVIQWFELKIPPNLELKKAQMVISKLQYAVMHVKSCIPVYSFCVFIGVRSHMEND